MVSGYKTPFLLSLVCLSWSACLACATDVERRDFAVLIDGKETGFSRMVITTQDDGVTVMQGTCGVKFTKLLFTFNYNIEATEWWKDGKLIGLKSKSQENSKKNEVTGSLDGAQFRLRANGADKVIRPDAWTTSYWKLADSRFHNKPVPLLDPEDGKEFNGQLNYVGTQQLTINKVPQNCYHFRVSGGPQTTNIWYDKFHRMVRQEFTEQGHHIIVQLNSITR